METEDQEHVMLHCSNYDNIREELKEELRKMMNTEDQYLWLSPREENNFFPETLACRGTIPQSLNGKIQLAKAKNINGALIEYFKKIWNKRNNIVIMKGLTVKEQEFDRTREHFEELDDEEEREGIVGTCDQRK